MKFEISNENKKAYIVIFEVNCNEKCPLYYVFVLNTLSTEGIMKKEIKKMYKENLCYSVFCDIVKFSDFVC